MGVLETTVFPDVVPVVPLESLTGEVVVDLVSSFFTVSEVEVVVFF